MRSFFARSLIFANGFFPKTHLENRYAHDESKEAIEKTSGFGGFVAAAMDEPRRKKQLQAPD
jgi:hypothetical protein